MHVEKLFQYEYNPHQFNELFRKIKIVGTLEKFENKTTNFNKY